MYHQGQGVTQDYKQAVYWFQEAATQGLAEAQFNLGVMLACWMSLLDAENCKD